MSRQELSPIPAFRIASAKISKGPVERPRSEEYMPEFRRLLNPGPVATHFKRHSGSATSITTFNHPLQSNPTVSDQTRRSNQGSINVSVIVINLGGSGFWAPASITSEYQFPEIEPTHLNMEYASTRRFKLNRRTICKAQKSTGRISSAMPAAQSHLIERLMKP